MHCKAPVWVKPNLGEAQLGHQASAEYKLRFYLGLRDVYFAAVHSAGSETERVVLKETVETQNRSSIRQVYDWQREMLQKVVTPEQEERERRAIAWKARYLSGRV